MIEDRVCSEKFLCLGGLKVGIEGEATREIFEVRLQELSISS